MADVAGLDLDIPGGKHLQLLHLVLDFNGTLARDGVLIRGVIPKLGRLSKILEVQVLTGDTFGTATRAMAHTSIQPTIIKSGKEKARHVERLGAEHVVAIGNGFNDFEMLRVAGLSICILGPEGAAVPSLNTSMLVMPSIGAALDALARPSRLIAGLRS